MTAPLAIDRAAVVEALKSGMTKVQAAQRFGVSERTIYSIGKKAGWKGIGGGARKRGDGPSEIERRSQAEIDAQQAYLRSLIADVPDPAQYARTLTGDLAALLLSARYDRNEPGWWVTPAAAKILRPMGLCEAGTNLPRYFLGSFGRAVMRELEKDWQ